MATWNNILFPDAASPMMEQLIFLHDHAMVILTLITILVAYMMVTSLTNTFFNRNLLEGQMLEIFWTIIPAFMLIFIALPSLTLLYSLDEISTPSLTIKILGNQWYWSYEYPDFNNLNFDSYMLPTDNISPSDFRLLDVDNRMMLPLNTNTRLLISSADVIHSWAQPSFGAKIDAVPGRMNQIQIMTDRPGLYFGQCSEICGANHSFMPIVVEATPIKYFISWVKSAT